MLLDADEPDAKTVASVQSWDSWFTERFHTLMKPFGWRMVKDADGIVHEPPSTEWTIVRKKGRPARPFGVVVYNPLFEIYYKDRFVGKILVDVGGWSTDYTDRVDTSTLEVLPLVEKLPFDDLIRSRITDFIAWCNPS